MTAEYRIKERMGSFYPEKLTKVTFKKITWWGRRKRVSESLEWVALDIFGKTETIFYPPGSNSLYKSPTASFNSLEAAKEFINMVIKGTVIHPYPTR